MSTEEHTMGNPRRSRDDARRMSTSGRHQTQGRIVPPRWRLRHLAERVLSGTGAHCRSGLLCARRTLVALPSQTLLEVVPILARRLFRLALVAVRVAVFASLVIVVPAVGLLLPVRLGRWPWRCGRSPCATIRSSLHRQSLPYSSWCRLSAVIWRFSQTCRQLRHSHHAA